MGKLIFFSLHGWHNSTWGIWPEVCLERDLHLHRALRIFHILHTVQYGLCWIPQTHSRHMYLSEGFVNQTASRGLYQYSDSVDKSLHLTAIFRFSLFRIQRGSHISCDNCLSCCDFDTSMRRNCFTSTLIFVMHSVQSEPVFRCDYLYKAEQEDNRIVAEHVCELILSIHVAPARGNLDFVLPLLFYLLSVYNPKSTTDLCAYSGGDVLCVLCLLVALFFSSAQIQPKYYLFKRDIIDQQKIVKAVHYFLYVFHI